MATEAATAAAAGAPAAAEHATGMPQLDPSTYPNQIFWLVVALVVIFYILTRIALPRIGAVLAERAGTISNDIATAEELSLKVKEAEAHHEKALIEARAQANKIIEQTKAEIKAELDAATARADQQIAAKAAESEKAILAVRASATQSIREVALDTVGDIVSAMGGQADTPAIETAVAERTKG